VHRVGGALVPVTSLAPQIRLQHADATPHAVEVPGTANADMVVQAVRTVLGQYGNSINSRVDAVRQREVDDAVLSRERHRRLGALSRQYAESLPLPASQDDGGHIPHRHVPEV